MIYAATGHRPDKLGGWTREVHDALCDFALREIARIRPSGMISGMALGWDHAVAVACVRLGIPFVAAVPFEGQESRWSERAQGDYHKLLLCASSVHVVVQRDVLASKAEYRGMKAAITWAMHLRDEWMVDNSARLLALWNGDRSGGTYHTVSYAREGRRDITNLWDRWDEWWNGGLYLV